MSLAIAIPSPAARGFAQSNDRVTVQTELTALVSPPGASRSPFREAMHYAVLGNGQRLRPVLSLRVARALGIESPLTLRAAAAVELIHCASLIVDDLPCMDNESERRGRPTTHKVFGESTALLAAFGLVGLAGRCLLTLHLDPAACAPVLHFQSHLLGVLDASGLCEGQDLDLRLQGDDRALLRSRINELKTVPLFDLAGRAGTLPLNPDSPIALSAVEFSRSFGRAYQLADDFLDGEIPTRARALTAIRKARAALHPIPDPTELHHLLDYLEQRIHENRQ